MKRKASAAAKGVAKVFAVMFHIFIVAVVMAYVAGPMPIIKETGSREAFASAVRWVFSSDETGETAGPVLGADIVARSEP